MKSLRAKLADKGTEVLGVWLSLGNAYAAEIAARSGNKQTAEKENSSLSCLICRL